MACSAKSDSIVLLNNLEYYLIAGFRQKKYNFKGHKKKMSTEPELELVSKTDKDTWLTYALCLAAFLGCLSLISPAQTIDIIIVQAKVWIWGLIGAGSSLLEIPWEYDIYGIYLLLGLVFLAGIGILAYLVINDFKKIEITFGENRYLVEI
ncbi:MAG: hypothetical protein KAR20_21400, partial [Candidatus Heimdallarchaeota archaeon]|nr:hypothetical protein [Candidatus Heimdallarchaeota archaeon]